MSETIFKKFACTVLLDHQSDTLLQVSLYLRIYLMLFFPFVLQLLLRELFYPFPLQMYKMTTSRWVMFVPGGDLSVA